MDSCVHTHSDASPGPSVITCNILWGGDYTPHTHTQRGIDWGRKAKKRVRRLWGSIWKIGRWAFGARIDNFPQMHAYSREEREEEEEEREQRDRERKSER